MQTSDSIKALATALNKFQASVEGATKNAQNPHLKNRYADLASVWDAIRQPLADNGLSITQWLGGSDDGTMASVTTRLAHVSGEWMQSTLTMPVTKRDPQGFGSAYTYARRYSLMAVCGICPVDDDGEAASRGHADADPSPWLKRLEAAKTPDEAREIARQARAGGLSGIPLKAVMEAGAARVREMQEAGDATAQS